uniref:Reverse transcriptase domain-containing protein n=1 Tax=Haemonchus contortus TaxID=6289 RepID=A0A7I4Z4F7_HAECO
MEQEGMEVKVGRRALLHHFRFADDIVLITPNIEQAERMLAEFDSACGKTGSRLKLPTTIFMKNGLVPDAPFTLNGTNISECSGYVYLGREVNMMTDLAPEMCRRKRAAWGAFENIEGVVKKKKDVRLRAYLFDTAVLPALAYASETWTLRTTAGTACSQRHSARCSENDARNSLRPHVQRGTGFLSSDEPMKIRDTVDYARKSKFLLYIIHFERSKHWEEYTKVRIGSTNPYYI